MSEKIKVICIDSFKPEYLKYAPYLSSLTKSYQHGELETSLGFEGQMEEFFTGQATKLAMYYKNENSSLKWTKNFSFIGKYALNILINLHRLFKNKRRLIFTHNIPLSKLHYFDTSVDYEPTQYTNIKYKHIGLDLDRTAHEYGTKSIETIMCIRKIDDWLKTQNFDIVMSDHGMTDIKETITLPETEVCFIDSTMARYWGDSPKLPLNKGRIIKSDPKYGETVFLVDPGILILPNYWQKNQVKAMHGYDPRHPDMKAFYLIKKEGNRKDLTMKQLHNLVFKSD